MNEDNKKVLDELTSIKKLMVADMYSKGISAESIGSILGVTERTVQNMIPTKKLRK